MARTTYTHNNFSAGQYDREFIGQDANTIHKNGLSFCKNVMSSIQGECKARSGTEWKVDIENAGVQIPYHFGNSDLLLLFQPNTLDIYALNAANELVPFQAGISTPVVWKNTNNQTPEDTPVSISGDISGNIDNFYQAFVQNTSQVISNYMSTRFFVKQISYPTAYFNMQFADKKALNQVQMEIMPADGNFNQPNFTSVKTWVKDAVLQYSDDGNNWTAVRLGQPMSIVGIREQTPYGARNVQAINFEPLSTSPHEYWRIVVVFNRMNMLNNAPFCVNLQGKVLSETIGEAKTYDTPYGADVLKSLKYSQQNNEMIICDGENNPYYFAMVGNAPTFESRDYSFIETDGVPACVMYFGNRLCFGGFKSFPTRIRASEFGNFSNFTVKTTEVVATDPVLADGNQITGRITDLFGGFTILYAQSSDGISFLDLSATGGSFTLRCYEKASGITPIMKENILFYVGYDKRKIHAFVYDKMIEQFTAPDVSQFWQEVLKDKITQLAYVNTRNKNIIGILENGKMFSMLYGASDDTASSGFFPQDIGANVYNACVLNNNNTTEIYLTVQRNGQWCIEKLHMPNFMKRTNGFMQDDWDRNLSTQENLLETPFFDGWKTLKNEYNQLWQYSQDTKEISPVDNSTNPVSLSPYLGQYVRFFYGAGIRDYVSAKIVQANTHMETIEVEKQIQKNVSYYGWSYAVSVVANPISGFTPATSGTYTRYPQGDGTGSYKYAWSQGSEIRYTTTPTPAEGNNLYKYSPRGYIAVATITSPTTGTVLTQTSIPSAGTNVYDTSFELQGTATSGNSTTLVYGSNTYTRNTDEDTENVETITETTTETIEVGNYVVDILEEDQQKDNIFTKLQLPITSFTDATIGNQTIQIQDNGVYSGEYTGTQGVITLREPMYNIQYGYGYEKIAVITEIGLRDRAKEWGTINLAVIDTMDLQIGSSMDKLTQVVEYNPSQDYYDSNPIMVNGVINKNIQDTDAYEKNLILYGKKGLPFCVVGLEADLSISDIGGN